MATRSKEKIDRMSLEDAREHMDEIAFVDTRSTTALSRNPLKVPGAIYLPLKELANGLQRLPRNRTIVTYCTCSDERTSTRAARQLKEHGFSHVYRCVEDSKAGKRRDSQ